MGIYVGCLSVGGPAAEVFRRCGSAFRAEGLRALEELGVEGGGELAGWAGRLVAGRPASHDGYRWSAAYVASSCCRNY